MKKLTRAAAIGLLAFGSQSHAGVFTDDLSRCLVDKTTLEDKTVLVQWIFVAMAQHPSVASMTKVTADDVKVNNQRVGALFMRLLTESCVDVSKKAIKNEGAVAIQSAFQVLGQAAAGELFVHPDVTKVMAGLEQFLDAKKLESLAQ
jgi:hypothetical protein